MIDYFSCDRPNGDQDPFLLLRYDETGEIKKQRSRKMFCPSPVCEGMNKGNNKKTAVWPSFFIDSRNGGFL
jgi:hypothetical protein